MTLKAHKTPCGSCPYRRDVPSGVWAAHEYDKLSDFDNEMWMQPHGVFMCHQRDEHLCAGWLATHGPENLLAIRFAAVKGELDPSVWTYTTETPCFASGQEACDHGKAEIAEPGLEARRKVAGLMKILPPQSEE